MYNGRASVGFVNYRVSPVSEVFECCSFSSMESILGCLCVVQLDRI